MAVRASSFRAASRRPRGPRSAAAFTLTPTRLALVAATVLVLLPGALVPRVHAEGVHGAFVHGVASGDPTSDGIVIWTRVTPTGRDGSAGGDVDPSPSVTFTVDWVVSTARRVRAKGDDRSPERVFLSGSDEEEEEAQRPPPTGTQPAADVAAEWEWEEESVAARGRVTASGARDWTVKVDVAGLRHGVQYYYGFNTTGGQHSPSGTFRLPPPMGTPYASPSSGTVRYAVFSCSNWGWGHFHAYDAAAKGWGAKLELDAWIHLGDYYYEYGDTHYPDADEAPLDRWASLQPRHETVTLGDYRRRHALHRSDLGLQTLSASAPLIAMWDDHEVANNEWMRGAEDHQADREGAYADRVTAALRAYHEWLPTREPVGSAGSGDPLVAARYNRTVHFGDVASVIVLETRLTARTDPNVNPAGNVFTNVSREIAGSKTPHPAAWPGSELERRLKRIKSELDGYRSKEEAVIVGQLQLEWVRDSTKASADAGVAWQVFAQGSVVQDMMSPDLEAAAAALDAGRGDTTVPPMTQAQAEAVLENGQRVAHPPPRGHASWSAALRAWTDWDGVASSGGRGVVPAAGEGGLDVPVADARALLAMGRFRINWNFDDWHGYAAERRRFLTAALPNAKRAVVLGGDSHDAWAGIVSSDPAHWRVAGSWSDENEKISVIRDGDIGAVEFDGPAVTSPGGFERGFPWCPTRLIDAGHVAGNAPTLRYARTGRRGFMLVTASRQSFTTDFIFTPSVREPTYTPECSDSFEASGVGSNPGGGGMSVRRRECPPLPRALFSGPHARARRAETAEASSSSAFSAFRTILTVFLIVAAVGAAAWYVFHERVARGSPREGGGGRRRYREFDAEERDEAQLPGEDAGVEMSARRRV